MTDPENIPPMRIRFSGINWGKKSIRPHRVGANATTAHRAETRTLDDSTVTFFPLTLIVRRSLLLIKGRNPTAAVRNNSAGKCFDRSTVTSYEMRIFSPPFFEELVLFHVRPRRRRRHKLGYGVVHLSCPVVGATVLTDSLTNVSAYALGLTRTIEMFQWNTDPNALILCIVGHEVDN